MTPDDNDIVYSQYTPDLLGFVRRIAEILTGSDMSADSFMDTLIRLWDIYTIIAFILSALFIIGIIYSYIRMGQLSEIEAKQLYDAEAEWKRRHASAPQNQRWVEVRQHLMGGSVNDWKAAVIEADIMLGESLANAGYGGLTIGDQLNSAASGGLKTLQEAWDAHKIRNRIAHEGAAYNFTQAEAKEAIYKYERVFQELGVV